MIGPDSKISNKVLNQRTEISEKNTKFRLPSKCRPESNKVLMEVSSKKEISATCLPPETAAKHYREACDHQVKMKLLGLTPRNPEKETSEGVQEFIKHVSDIIENKNPLKKTSRCSYRRGGEKNANSPAYKSIQFNGVSKNFQGRKKSEDFKLDRNSVIELEERDTNSSKNPKCIENPVPSPGKDSVCTNGKTSKRSSATKRRELSVTRFERDVFLEAQKTEKKASKNICSLYQNTEGQDVTLLTRTHLSQERVTSAPLQNQFKRRRPSEIPLRKDRMDSTRKPKPLSLLLRKPLETVESTAPVDSSSRDNLFSPIEDLDLCSELQMIIKLDLSSEKINIIDEEIQLPFSEETARSINLNRCYKSTNVPEISKLSSESKREKPSPGKKSKVIDCERVKTSSFTAISSRNTVLDRLESLHKKNVHSKEKTLSEKIALHRKKDLVLKTSQSSLQGKTSKKYLFSSFSSKGNKAGPSMKAKRTKRDGNQDPGNPQKSKRRPKMGKETPHLHIYREVTASGKVGSLMPTNRKMETIKYEGLKANASELEKDEDQQRRVKSARRKSTPRNLSSPRDKEKPKTPSERRVSGSEFENPKYEITKSAINKTESTEDLEVGRSSEKDVETAIQTTRNAIPTTPPPTPENRNGFNFPQMEEDDEWASKTVENKFNNENYAWCTIESETDPVGAKIVTETTELSSTESSMAEKAKLTDLVVMGMSLNYGTEERFEKPEGMDSPTVKKRLKINLSAHGVTSDCDGVEDGEENESASIKEETRKGPTLDKATLNDTEREGKEGKSKSGKNGSADSVSPVVVEEPASLSLDLQKPRKSCLSLKRKSNYNSGGSVKGARKKKVRSDAGDRPSPSASIFFNSDVALQSKTKPDTKQRSGLTKSSKQEEKLHMLEDTAALKLRRRNSEPNSFRGYVWKCLDSATPRGNKASVSSMTSSLRHLNTDEIDDFIFWEAVPQKLTSCWEMSLYNFKRPWSVLSFSVFRDNRKSNTPGLILENLRNGGTLNTRRSTINQSERVACRKENPFDVEPSIAQKNIDIRNWLAALNFPTLPSTSADVLGEGNFSSQIVVETRSMNKTQVNQKRRKVLPNLKFSDEAPKKKADEEKKEYVKSTRWNPNDQEGLTELIRRKSGGFVTKEQYLNSEISVHRPNVTVNFCVYSKSAEESIMTETSDKNAVCEPRKYKSVEVASQPEVSISATIISSGALCGDQLVEKIKTKEKSPQEMAVGEGNGHSGKMLKGEPGRCRTDVNIWKYLFILTLFIIIIHYWFTNSYVCRN